MQYFGLSNACKILPISNLWETDTNGTEMTKNDSNGLLKTGMWKIKPGFHLKYPKSFLCYVTHGKLYITVSSQRKISI